MKYYWQLANFLAAGRKHHHKRIEGNTYVGWDGDNIYVQYYYTRILYFYENGDVRINTGGYNTISTRKRINDYSNVMIWTTKGCPVIRLPYFKCDKDNFLFTEKLTLADAITIGTPDLLYQWWENQTEPLLMFVFSRGFHKSKDRERVRKLIYQMRFLGLNDDARIIRGWEYDFKKFDIDKAMTFGSKHRYLSTWRTRPFVDGMLFDESGTLIEEE